MKNIFAKLMRRLIRAQLQKTSPEKLHRLGERRLLRAFRRASGKSPAYRTLLAENKVNARSVSSVPDFVRLCPILEKSNTFLRFPLKHLIADDVSVDQLASILTSSGHGSGGFALGLSTRNQMKASPSVIDLGLELAFDIDSYRTLLVNCLPMGVTFQSNAVCVANVSVREDMASAIIAQAGDLFEQIILCGDPLFLKKLCDYSQAKNLDWSKYRMNVIVGEETFTESFRDYLAGVLHISPDIAGGGLIGSSMGVGELGLNLFNETRETIALRRACDTNPALLEGLFGSGAANYTLPAFLVFSPLRVFVEIDAIDEFGAGDLLVSVLDETVPIPLLRYKTGDRASLISTAQLEVLWQNSGITLPLPSLPIIALHGRAKDCLPNQGHVDEYKNALYQHPEVAQHLSGAFRLTRQSDGLLWEIQLRQGDDFSLAEIASRLQENASVLQNKTELICYTYENFPYGKTLEYERKFNYWFA